DDKRGIWRNYENGDADSESAATSNGGVAELKSGDRCWRVAILHGDGNAKRCRAGRWRASCADEQQLRGERTFECDSARGGQERDVSCEYRAGINHDVGEQYGEV